MCVLVVPKEAGREAERDRFSVLAWKELQDVLVRGYEAYSLKHGGVRPKKRDSFHDSLGIEDVKEFENDWHKILDRIPMREQISCTTTSATVSGISSHRNP